MVFFYGDDDQGNWSQADFQESIAPMGIERDHVDNIGQLLEDSSNANFVCIPLFHPRMRRSSHLTLFGNSSERMGLVTRSEKQLPGSIWASHVIGMASSWISLDSNDSLFRLQSETALKEEFDYATYLGLQVFVMSSPVVDTGKFHNFPRFVSTLLRQSIQSNAATQIWLKIPLLVENEGLTNAIDGWDTWNMTSTIVRDSRLGIILEIPIEVSDSALHKLTKFKLARWLGEPVKAISISTESFRVKSFDTKDSKKKTKKKKIIDIALDSRIEHLVKNLHTKGIQIIVRGRPHQVIVECHKFRKNQTIIDVMQGYYLYLGFLQKNTNEGYKDSLYDRFVAPYTDSLRGPLQPLAETLDSETYNIMEKDPVKYNNYEVM